MKTYRLQPVEARQAEASEPHIARRAMQQGSTANLKCGAADSVAGLMRTALPEANRPGEGVPIWLAALVATSCEAKRNGEQHAVRWNWVSGRALYTNIGREAEHIEPLGVSLLGGHTMAVWWMPGETAYTVEIYRQTERCA